VLEVAAGFAVLGLAPGVIHVLADLGAVHAGGLG
jgi:hypothetical protein